MNYIRTASLDDVQRIIDINNELTGNKWLEEKFYEMFDCNIPVIVVCNGDKKILGFCVYMFVLEEVRVLHICVSSENRRTGIANQLLEWSFIDGQQNECRYALLEVETTNVAGLNLYKKLGFTELCVRKEYYDDLADAYFMQYVL